MCCNVSLCVLFEQTSAHNHTPPHRNEIIFKEKQKQHRHQQQQKTTTNKHTNKILFPTTLISIEQLCITFFIWCRLFLMYNISIDNFE